MSFPNFCSKPARATRTPLRNDVFPKSGGRHNLKRAPPGGGKTVLLLFEAVAGNGFPFPPRPRKFLATPDGGKWKHNVPHLHDRERSKKTTQRLRRARGPDEKKGRYTCPMHPEVVQVGPGISARSADGTRNDGYLRGGRTDPSTIDCSCAFEFWVSAALSLSVLLFFQDLVSRSKTCTRLCPTVEKNGVDSFAVACLATRRCVGARAGPFFFERVGHRALCETRTPNSVVHC